MSMSSREADIKGIVADNKNTIDSLYAERTYDEKRWNQAWIGIEVAIKSFRMQASTLEKKDSSLDEIKQLRDSANELEDYFRNRKTEKKASIAAAPASVVAMAPAAPVRDPQQEALNQILDYLNEFIASLEKLTTKLSGGTQVETVNLRDELIKIRLTIATGKTINEKIALVENIDEAFKTAKINAGKEEPQGRIAKWRAERPDDSMFKKVTLRTVLEDYGKKKSDIADLIKTAKRAPTPQG